MKKKPLIVIVGPTAVGKTALSIELAKYFCAEIISGDSMQVYKYMNIGTAKIHEDEKKGIKHHLIDILEPEEPFNARTFKLLASNEIENIYSRNNIPMVVGGTGLYINGLMYDYQFDGNTNHEYREKVYKEMIQNGTEKYYKLLTEKRPNLKNKIHKNDAFRISRALEIMQTSGKDNLGNFCMKDNYDSKYQLCLIGLSMDRKKLYSRIELRIDQMLENGLVEELEALLKKGYNKEMQSLQAIGYKEMMLYLEGKLSYTDSVALLKKNTRHFAKRQLTWFNRDPNLKWFFVDTMNDLELQRQTKKYIQQCLNL